MIRRFTVETTDDGMAVGHAAFRPHNPPEVLNTAELASWLQVGEAIELAFPLVAHERDLFANFERMRREMDELFGDVFDRRLAPSRRGGFSPAVDVYYTADPPRAVVRADLAGIDPSEIELQIRGRELVLGGHRKPEGGQDRAYQQLEIEHGPFRRVISLGVDVDSDAAQASYEDGILTVELPLARPSEARTVPIQQRSEDE